MLDCKVIYLVRDPRAELSSIISFNEKRGSNYFGWKDEDTIESFVSRFISQRYNYFKMLEKRELDKDCLIIKYEDLVLDIDIVCEKISNYLATKVHASKVIENIQNNSKHMTSSDPQASLSKWKKDLPKKIIDQINLSLVQGLGNNFYKC